MATKEEIVSAVEIVREFAGNPEVGVVAELLQALLDSVATPVKETRVVEPKETR
jgi:hypothetical protein